MKKMLFKKKKTKKKTSQQLVDFMAYLRYRLALKNFLCDSDSHLECGYMLELPWRGDINEYPQSMFLSKYKMYTHVHHVLV